MNYMAPHFIIKDFVTRNGKLIMLYYISFFINLILLPKVYPKVCTNM